MLVSVDRVAEGLVAEEATAVEAVLDLQVSAVRVRLEVQLQFLGHQRQDIFQTLQPQE